MKTIRLLPEIMNPMGQNRKRIEAMEPELVRSTMTITEQPKKLPLTHGEYDSATD